MIRINLLPVELRPVKRSALPYVVAAGVAFLAFIGMASVFIAAQANISSKRAELETHKAEFEGLQKIVKEVNDLAAQKERLANKIATIDEIVKDRTIWSRQLWNLSRLIPDNFWYSGISVEPKSFTETKMMPEKRTEGGKEITTMVAKQVPVTKTILKVSGYVTKAPNGSTEVNPLTFATANDPEFSNLFETLDPSTKRAEFKKWPVNSFTAEFVIIPMGKGKPQ